MNIENNITRYTDLENNDSLSAFKGHIAQQNHKSFQVFYDFIKEIKPKRILEIGTSLGGFTSFLKIVSDDLNLNINIRSYDIHKHPWYDDMINDGIDVRIENIFDSNFLKLNDEVIDYINQDGITIVLCDGGYKIGEFNLISNHIKNGDFILAHDYAENNEKFELNIKNKIWNWHEISESDISEACLRNNLQDYKRDVFESVVWICKIKKN